MIWKLKICNSIKNIIKIEPSFENNLRHNNNNANNTNSSNINSSSNNNNTSSNNNTSGVLPASLPSKLSSSLSFSRKKSVDPLASSKVDSPLSDIVFANANEVKSNLNEVYISPTSEIRKEAKRASVKIQQQQQLQSAEYLQQERQKQQSEVEQTLINAKEPPPPPKNPPPSSQSIERFDSISKSNNG